MKANRKYILVPFLVLLLVTFLPPVTAGAAAEESSAGSVTLNAVTLTQYSSYSSDQYFGVINTSVDDTTVAAATTDTLGHVVITAVGSGTTKVHYWFRSDALSGWTRATLPVTVSGTAVSAQESSIQTGIQFPQTSVTIPNGDNYTFSGITLNGIAINSESLLWVSSSNSVATVESSTGKITAVGLGTAVIYAIDPSSKSVATINLTVD